MKRIVLGCLVALAIGCGDSTSDRKQQQQQEVILAEATAAVGMPGIKNFRERRILKDILELRDQEGLVTYTYVENLNPQKVPGHTAMGGKFTFIGETIGYGIPYATQFTSPEKIEYWHGKSVVMPQADPNGLFSPDAAEGTWILMLNPKSKKAEPQYIESRIAVFTFQLPQD